MMVLAYLEHNRSPATVNLVTNWYFLQCRLDVCQISHVVCSESAPHPKKLNDRV